MNTPTHLLLNLTLLRVWRRARESETTRAVPTAPVVWGALLPDLPMFGFWLIQTLGFGRAQREIWSVVYFDPGWQRCFDAFNSVPVYGLWALAAMACRWRFGLWLAISALLHIATDLPLHREDAHAHFWPLTSWHFVSPVSYWDPAHHGGLFSVFELALLGACAFWLARGARSPWVRAALALCVLGATLGWVALTV